VFSVCWFCSRNRHGLSVTRLSDDQLEQLLIEGHVEHWERGIKKSKG
jgi:hypothetical protein